MATDQDNALITIGALKRYLDIPDTDSQYDVRLAEVVNSVSVFFNSKTNRLLHQRALTEYYDGSPTALLLLRNWPVAASPAPVFAYSTDLPRVWTGSSIIDSSAYVIDYETGRVYFQDYAFATIPQCIKATYTGGYGDVPADLQRAVLETCMVVWTNERDKTANKGSIQTPRGDTITLIEGTLSKFAAEVIELYRRPPG